MHFLETVKDDCIRMCVDRHLLRKRRLELSEGQCEGLSRSHREQRSSIDWELLESVLETVALTVLQQEHSILENLEG